MRTFLILVSTVAAMVLAPASLRAQDVTITIKNHRFTPSEVKVPANKRVQITVVNDDPTPEEFESHEMKVEKVIPGKSKGVVRIGPLAPARYPFFGEFNQATAKGVVAAEEPTLGAAIIVFREVIEAGLIVGIVMAATRGVAGRGRWVNIGIIAGVLGAAVVAMFANVISEAFQGAGQELFNASVLGAAVIMLMWHNAWMARHGREIADESARG